MINYIYSKTKTCLKFVEKQINFSLYNRTPASHAISILARDEEVKERARKIVDIDVLLTSPFCFCFAQALAPPFVLPNILLSQHFPANKLEPGS